MDDRRDRFSLLGRRLPASVVRRVVVIGPAQTLPYCEAQWRGALVVVEQGEIEIECARGGRRHFGCGAVLVLTGLDLVALHNEADVPTVLSAVSKKMTEEPVRP